MAKRIKLEPETKLERAVARWLRSEAKDREDGIAGVLADLMHGGCQSGMVGDLIYTRDCVKFYKRHADDIDVLLRDICSDCDTTPGKLFARAGWDDSDPLARTPSNQNILAWFGFEEAARALGMRADLDI